jgi:predicted MPP superfamily phosphohydrolase
MAKNKKVKKHIGWRIVSVVVGLVMLFSSATIITTIVGDNKNIAMAQSFDKVVSDNPIEAPVLDEDGYWTFTTDRDFKILQITDVHLGGGWMSLKEDSMAINAVATMVSVEKPDLVVFTGDIAYPVFFSAGTFNNMLPAKLLSELMETLGVYWTVCFGNHDTEVYSYYNREAISNFYASEDFEYCLFQKGPADIDSFGNHIINVQNSAGIVTQSLVILDSHAYTKDDPLGTKWSYDNIKQSQIDWYTAEINKITAANREIDSEQDTVKSLAIFHIPLTEYKVAYDEYVANGNVDTADTRWIYGVAGESGKVVYSSLTDDDVFETMLDLGSTQGIFCGHDHLNNFSAEYKGIRLTYGMSIDYLAYSGIDKIGSQRGCTVITTSTDGSFDCRAENYYQAKYVSKYTKETVTMD